MPMTTKYSDDPRPVAATVQASIPGLLAQSRAFMQLEVLLKKNLDQLPAHAYRVGCLRHGELSLFCGDSVWLARLRLLRTDILQVCRRLYAEQAISEQVTAIKIRVKADPASRFRQQ